MGKLKRKFKKIRREAIRRLMPASASEHTSNPHYISYVDRLMNQPIIASTPVLYSDLTGRIPTTDELEELIAPFKKQATFRMLCMLNTLLSFYAHDVPNSIKVQGFLSANFVGDELFEKIREKFGRDSMMG